MSLLYVAQIRDRALIPLSSHGPPCNLEFMKKTLPVVKGKENVKVVLSLAAIYVT